MLVTACGSSGGNTPNAPSTSIKVTLKDFYFSPKTFTVPVGKQISLTATNEGTHGHSFVIMQKGKDVEGRWNDAVDIPNIYWSMDAIVAGHTFTGSFQAPSDPGEYQIVCQVPEHFEAGMVGKLIVVNP
jgi:plastocyanin